MGCDSGRLRRPRRLPISIHAPQWGATGDTLSGIAAWLDFNPRTPVGCDMSPIQTLCGNAFQSTHPSGVRLKTRIFGLYCNHFNPRTPVGCDNTFMLPAKSDRNISIHAPQWGATMYMFTIPCVIHEFQSTHPSGVRLVFRHCRIDFYQFQSTHSSGVRQYAAQQTNWANEFQSTHPSGVRLAV